MQGHIALVTVRWQIGPHKRAPCVDVLPLTPGSVDSRAKTRYRVCKDKCLRLCKSFSEPQGLWPATRFHEGRLVFKRSVGPSERLPGGGGEWITEGVVESIPPECCWMRSVEYWTKTLSRMTLLHSPVPGGVQNVSWKVCSERQALAPLLEGG